MPAVPDDRAYIAPAFTWRPNEDTTVTFLGAYQKDKSGGSLFNYYSPTTGLLDIRTADPAWNDLDMESVRAGYQIEHRVDDALTLRQSFRYAHVDANTRYVYITGLSDDGNTVFRRAGVKYQPDGLNSLITASVFQITQDKGLIADASNINFRAQRGEIRVRGLELEGLADLGDGLSLQLAYTYLDPEVIEGTAATEGKDPSGIPNHIVSAWADYRVPDAVVPGLSLGAGLRYIGSSYRDDDNTTGRNEAVTLFDAAIRYDLSEIEPRLDGVQLAVNATNLFDRDYSTCTQGYCYQGQGQTVIGSIKYRW